MQFWRVIESASPPQVGGGRAVYVNRMRLLNVKSLHQDIPEGGGTLPEAARRRLLLQGANGSGKTTILETVFSLWKFWGQWLDVGGGFPPKEQLEHFLTKVRVQPPQLAAVEIIGIPSAQPLWIGIGGPTEWRGLLESQPKATFAGMSGYWEQMSWRFQLPPNANDLLNLRQRSLAGSETFPNVIYFQPECRTIRAPDSPRAEIIDTTKFNWTAVYDPAISLDSVLLTVKALSPERFDECLRLVNMPLEHRRKRITGFGPKGRLVVKGTTDSGTTFEHPIEELSSGERQMLLLIGFVVAFLRPGGIVLIDEPDLHIHIAMVTQLLQTLEYVVRERNGQLIVASHSELVWDYFSHDEERIELTPWRGQTDE
jgi:hypothetical protein